MQDVDDKFYGRADAHMNLSNKQITKDTGCGKDSALFLYSAARFNTYVRATGFNNRDEIIAYKDEAIEYFDNEYRKIFEKIMITTSKISKNICIYLNKKGKSYPTHLILF